jgi:beta-aspartyl-dipeptidase (metallo-type)
MITLILNGQIYDPNPRGVADLLILGGKIATVGRVDRKAVEALGIDVEAIDASGCLVVPGFIDPHEHLIGGSGEDGFSTQTPEIRFDEIVTAGITTVVGCLGVDNTTKTMQALVAKAKALREQGLDAFVWSGGYSVPTASLMGSTREDIVFIAEVIGAGEIAISDQRSAEAGVRELARLITDAHVGGMLSKKAGVTHFHVGDGPRRLELIRTLLRDTDVQPGWLYLTHVERSEPLMREAIELTGRGSFVDVDIVEEDLAKWLRFYFDNDGDPTRLTVSSDASFSSPRTLYEQVRACVLEHGFPFEQILPLVTANTAHVLKLGSKGALEPGKVADVVVLRKDSLEITDVLAGGRRIVERGRIMAEEPFLEHSTRRISLHGKKHERKK